jgi:Tol biopolymer transport system component
VADANGRNPTTISRNGDNWVADATPDRLVYSVTSSGETSLFTAAMDGNDRIEIARGASSLTWHLTPDRKHIIFFQMRNGRSTLQMTDLRHEQTQELKRGDSGEGFDWVVLANGRLLVETHEGTSNVGLTLSTMKLDGTDEQVIKRGLTNYPSTDVRGSDMVLGSQENGQGSLYLYTGKDPVLIDDEADSYDRSRFTPNGQILYTASFKSGPVIYLIDRNGKQRKPLVEDATILAAGF